MKRSLVSNQTKEHQMGKDDSPELDKRTLKVRQSEKTLEGEKLLALELLELKRFHQQKQLLLELQLKAPL